MSHFAEIQNGVVVRVIVIEPDVLATGRWGDPANWVQTSYSGAIRKNYAGRGHTFDAVRDAFIAPKPSPDAVLNEQTCQWVTSAPVEGTSANFTVGGK